jgi:hypothetical protein
VLSQAFKHLLQSAIRAYECSCQDALQLTCPASARNRTDADGFVRCSKDDRDIRSTLLHEMAHASPRPEKLSHSYNFWRELEMLLEQDAPIKIDFPETGRHPLAGNVVSSHLN